MYLFIFLLFYFFLAFILRSFLFWKKTKINPITFNRKDDAHGYNGNLFGLISIIEFAVVFIYAFVPSLHEYLLSFWYLENDSAVIIGWSLLLTSIIFVWITQSSMRDSWRIGIDEVHKTKLVTSSLFSYSRNPIFASMIIANFGLFLILPNAFTLLITSLSTVSINTQVRLEEEFLLKEFGAEYKQYKNKVNRWLGSKRS